MGVRHFLTASCRYLKRDKAVLRLLPHQKLRVIRSGRFKAVHSCAPLALAPRVTHYKLTWIARRDARQLAEGERSESCCGVAQALWPPFWLRRSPFHREYYV